MEVDKNEVLYADLDISHAFHQNNFFSEIVTIIPLFMEVWLAKSEFCAFLNI